MPLTTPIHPQHAVSEQYRSETLTEEQGKVLGSNLAQTISLARVMCAHSDDAVAMVRR